MTAAARSSANHKKHLGSEFKAVGLNSKSTFEAMPEWWHDAILEPSGVYEIKGFVAKYFGLEIGPDGALRRRSLPQACFKTRSGTDVSEVASARAFATAVARMVASVTTVPWKGSLSAAAALRQTILGRGRPWVGLTDLLSVCWAHGVPVVYLPNLPVGTPKMEGMVTFCAGHPVIVATKKASHPAWLLFILAHEMGHLGSGHLSETEGGAIMDEKVSEDDPMDDDQEKEANRFALQLLTGGMQGIPLGRAMYPSDLAAAANSYGANKRIDPGHVVLNAIYNQTFQKNTPWQLANATLKHINHDGGATEELCRAALRCHVDTDGLTDDGFDFIERLGLI